MPLSWDFAWISHLKFWECRPRHRRKYVTIVLDSVLALWFRPPVSESDWSTFAVLSFHRPYDFILRLLILSILGHVPKMLRGGIFLRLLPCFILKHMEPPHPLGFMENCLQKEVYRPSQKKFTDMLYSDGEKRINPVDVIPIPSGVKFTWWDRKMDPPLTEDCSVQYRMVYGYIGEIQFPRPRWRTKPRLCYK